LFYEPNKQQKYIVGQNVGSFSDKAGST